MRGVNQMSDTKTHQDYADWKITGNRYYMTNLDWSEVNNEAEEVITVDGEKITCEDCGIEKPCLKLTCNTPSFHHSASGICLECNVKVYGDQKYRSIVSEKDIFKTFNDNVSDVLIDDMVQRMNDSDESKVAQVLRILHERGVHTYCVTHKDKHIWDSDQV